MGKWNWLNLAHEIFLEICSANTEAVPRIERKSYRSIDSGCWNWTWIWRAGTWKKMKKMAWNSVFKFQRPREHAVESIINGNPVIIFSNIQSSNPVIIFSRCNTIPVALTMSFFSLTNCVMHWVQIRKYPFQSLWLWASSVMHWVQTKNYPLNMDDDEIRLKTPFETLKPASQETELLKFETNASAASVDCKNLK